MVGVWRRLQETAAVVRTDRSLELKGQASYAPQVRVAARESDTSHRCLNNVNKE